MKIFPGLVAATVLFALSSFGQPTPAPNETGDYEELPELKASEILRPEFLQGDFFKVLEEVSTASGANHFTIESHFGVFEADGNEMLVRRINEINAIAKLREVSRTDQFKEALTKAAKSPLIAAKNIVTDPVNTIKNVPKGLGKFMKRAGESIKGIGKNDESSTADGSKAQQLIGFTDTKRKVAISLGVDPYSTNPVLQKELDGISWASFAGGLSFKVATLPIGGGAGAALTVTGVSSSVEEVLRDKTPTDLKIMNRQIFQAMGAKAADIEALLKNDAFSPTAQTAFAFNLRALQGVANRGAFVRLAGRTSSSEADAIFCVRTAALMGNLHKGETPLARIEMIDDFPICVAKDGTTVLVLQWDYAAWTSAAAGFSAKLRKFADEPPANKKVLVAISGETAPRLRTELQALGDQVMDHLSPGPLK